MSVNGDFRTMPLVELLQWVAANEKTGVLELERNKIRKQISFRNGRVVGCSSDDPSTRIGQILISRGKISERTLHFALEQQKTSGRGVPDILVQMGVITEDEVAAQVASKAAETIHGMFEWDDAIFRFELETALDRYHIDVDLSVEGILLDGAQRQDELNRFRGVFSSSGIVVKRTDRPIPSEVQDGALTFQVLEFVDTERTLAEILSRAHASEYHVLKLLFALHNAGNIEIVGERQISGGTPTLIDVREDDAPIPLPSLAQFSDPNPGAASDADSGLVPETELPSIDMPEPSSREQAEGEPSKPSIEEADLPVLLQVASERAEHGNYEDALSILDACYAARPQDESLKQRMVIIESAYLQVVRAGLMQAQRVPIRTEPIEGSDEQLQPAQTSLLGMCDGKRTIQSILWIAPMRELQVMRALHQLHDKGIIRFADAPAATEAEPPAGETLAV